MWILVTWPGGTIERDLPRAGEFTIGRGEECDLVIPHRSVSRRHAKLHLGATIKLEDLHSANGTLVGEQRLEAGARLVVRSGTSIQLGDVVLLLRGSIEKGSEESEAPRSLARDLREVERARIIDALERCGGNQTRAAELLGISRRTLVGRMTEYDLPRPLKDRR
jgi:DNA-binding NtrC family response regulator